MRLRDFIRPELVVTDLRANDVSETVHALVAHLGDCGVVPDGAAVAEALLAREAVHTTAMGNGVAVPHATVPGLHAPLIMVAVSPIGTPFGPVGLDPVRVFFVLLSPPERASLHIKLLARIARLVRHPGFLDRLHSARDPAAVLEAVERVDAEHV